MGLTVLEVDVANVAAPDTLERVEFLIDSGAIYSVVPTAVLERLHIQPLVEQQFRLANGDKIVRRKGVAVFRYGDRVGGADVIFGEPGDAALLGAFTLEALGLALDPLRRELRELPMLLSRLRVAAAQGHSPAVTGSASSGVPARRAARSAQSSGSVLWRAPERRRSRASAPPAPMSSFA
jgi:predicted aspartyl protease